jgi:hypothetical protein
MSFVVNPDETLVAAVALPRHVQTQCQQDDGRRPSFIALNIVYVEGVHYETSDGGCKCGKCVCASLLCIAISLFIMFVLGFYAKS